MTTICVSRDIENQEGDTIHPRYCYDSTTLDTGLCTRSSAKKLISRVDVDENGGLAVGPVAKCDDAEHVFPIIIATDKIYS